MLYQGATLCYTLGVGRSGKEEDKMTEFIHFLTAVVGLITAIILWQTAKRDKRK